MIQRPQVLVLTPGDPDGIGAEITWKMLQKLWKKLLPHTAILCVGAKEPFLKLKAPVVLFDPKKPAVLPKKGLHPFVWLYPAPETCPKKLLLEGFQAGWSIEKATQLVLEGFAAGLVTGPINKDRLQKGGFLYSGHTEFLAQLCAPRSKAPKLRTGSIKASLVAPQVTPQVTMMLANDQLRVSLVTTHLSVQKVSRAITPEKIKNTIHNTVDGLQSLWGIQKPRLALAALNPHAGEQGLFGREEIEVISPALKQITRSSRGTFTLEGPFPADTLFAKQRNAAPRERFDAVVCMYHDQGLIPVKLLDFPNTVNITLGLPIIRTSVDHGVGFDIAGKGIADPSSLCAAVNLATRFIPKRGRKQQGD